MKPSECWCKAGSSNRNMIWPRPGSYQPIPDPYLDTAIYHCQQAAEKAVKGCLVFHDQRFEKTHDIEALISLAIPFNAQFSSWLGAGQRLTSYAAVFRYPGEILEPDQAEFDQALQTAEGLYAFVLTLLSAEVHP